MLKNLPYSGAAATNGSAEYDLITALQKSYKQKEKIGKFAASLICENDIIIIDTGSTTSQMVSFIPTTFNLTVLCYSTNILYPLLENSGVNILFCGGLYHRNTEMFESPEGLQYIKRIRANKVFISAAGIHENLGVTCANEYEVPTKHAIIDSSQEKILVADSSKFDIVRSSYFCELTDIDAIITDNHLSEKWQDYIRSKSIKLYLV